MLQLLPHLVQPGRVQAGLARQRTLSLGMQQILEASEGLPISPPSQVSARLSFQRFFRLFSHVGGMTGTAQEARNEFAAVYGLATLPVPTHRPLQRRFLQINEFLGYEAIAFNGYAPSSAGVGSAEQGRESAHRELVALNARAGDHELGDR